MITCYWIIGAIALLIIEMITISLTSIWFAGGAVAAAIVSVFTASIVIQAAVFIIVSLLLLVITRPIAAKYMNSKIQKTNVEALVGRKCKVAVTIDASAGTGMIKIGDVEWKARASQDNLVIPKGTEVVIKKVTGVRLIVEPVI